MISLLATLAVSQGVAYSATLSTVAVFTREGPYGAYPSLISRDAKGRVYGGIHDRGLVGAATVFRYDPQTNQLSAALSSGPSAANVTAERTIADSAGNIYGIADDRLFRLNTSNDTISFGASFPHGSLPDLGCIDPSGNIYGISRTNGASGIGTLFVVRPGATQPETLASFTSAIGGQPVSGLACDAFGNLYGATRESATSPHGTLFKWNPATQALSRLVAFNGVNGHIPRSPPVIDSAGFLYGTTAYGGFSQAGSIYKYSIAQGILVKLADFAPATTGRYPLGEPILDAAGNLYGVTNEGGPDNRGVVYKVVAGLRTITPLASMTSSDGNYQTGNLVALPNGDLIGVSQVYGGHPGAVFRVSGSGFVVPEPTVAVATLALFALPRRR